MRVIVRVRYRRPFSGTTSSPAPRALHLPLPGAVRCAVLDGRFSPQRDLAVFPQGYTPGLAAFAPEALAGTLPQLRALACELVAGTASLPSLSQFLVVCAEPTGHLLSAEDRDLLWRVFRLPVFEQVYTSAGELIATECEAHAGLHLVPGRTLARADQQRTEELCGCGLGTPRLLPTRAVLPVASKADMLERITA